MTKHNREKKRTNYRLAVIDDKSHEQLVTIRFTKTSAFVAILTILVMLCALVYSITAYTPVRTFIPGYPDAHSKRAAIQNAIKVDSLERVIFRWEMYSENLKRVLAGEEALKIDSILISTRKPSDAKADVSGLMKQDSLLRQNVMEEEQFGISARKQRDLPVEGMLFFTPLKGVVSQGYDPAIHPYVDITAPSGSVVKAVLDGTVIFSGWSDDAGHTIQIQHDGDIVSIYKHNEKLLKKTGDKVSAGTPIALVGNTGEMTTGAHLHFELWHKGETLDPTKHISF
jgi:murein DD-endopeptidase MepM/ murein hydrolase activator NlpD